MSVNHYGGNTIPEITREEHDGTNNAKRVNVVAGNLTVTDLQIGAVEIKNSTDDTRAIVDSYGLATKATIFEKAPTDATKTNGSLVLGYTGSNLTTITKTIGATSYVKTLTYSGSTLTDVSAWV